MVSHAPSEDFHGSGTPDDWLVPRASGPVRALVRLPGPKSMTNRALVLAALSDRPTLIIGPLVARDTRLMADALRALACRITESADGGRGEPAALGLPGGPASPRPAGRRTGAGNAGAGPRVVPPRRA